MTINLTTDFTIAEDEVYTGSSGSVFYMEQYPDDWVFQNYGTIHATGANVIGFLGWNAVGDFLNAGVIRVDSTGGLSYGVFFQSWGPDFVNTGRIELNGHGQAFRSFSPGQRLENHGTIIATDNEGGGHALWFRNGAELINHGEIIARGPAAVAVFIDNFHRRLEVAPTVYIDAFFENDGTILAEGSGGGPTYALMLDCDWENYRPENPNIINNGLIQADRAVWWVGHPNLWSMEWVVNHGEMYGDVFLGTGDDQFVSDGVFVGHLDMYDGNDVVDLSLNTGEVTVDLGSGDDRAVGGTRADRIDAGDGADLVEGGDGADYLDGSSGDDRLIGGSGADEIWGGLGRDTLDGGEGNDVLNGDLAYGYGWNGDDRLSGGTGDDHLAGGVGQDWIDGGEGYDTAVFFGLRSQYQITSVDGVVTIRGPEGVDTLVGIERLEFFDGYYSTDGALIAWHETATPGDDEITGGVDRDRIRGGDGDDVIDPLGGTDLIDGGAGHDVVWLDGHRDDYKIVPVGDDFLIARHYSELKYLTRVEEVRFRDGGVVELNRMYGMPEDDPMVLPIIGGPAFGHDGPLVLPSREGGLAKQAPDLEVLPLGSADSLPGIVWSAPPDVALTSDEFRWRIGSDCWE